MVWTESFFRCLPLVGYVDDTFSQSLHMILSPWQVSVLAPCGTWGSQSFIGRHKCYSAVILTAPLIIIPLLQMINPKSVVFFHKFLIVSSWKHIWFLSWIFSIQEFYPSVTRCVSFSFFNLQRKPFSQPRKMFQLFVLAPPSVPFFSFQNSQLFTYWFSQICLPSLAISISLYFCSEF